MIWLCIAVAAAIVLTTRLAQRRESKERHDDIEHPPIHDRINIKWLPFDFGRELSEDACPYCETTIEPPPRRARKCPYCKRRVERATIEGNRKVLLTGEEFHAYTDRIAAEYCRRWRAQRLESFEFDKRRAQSCGSVSYIWRTTSDDNCVWCLRNDEKRFRWDAHLVHGHAGLCDMCPEGYCRCWYETVLPDDNS